MNLAVIALLAGALIGVSLGALGAGGSILAVPVLVFGLGQTPVEATTGSLVVVGVTALIGTITAWRTGHLLPGPGLAFGLIAIIGAAAGALASARVSGIVLLAAFSVLMLTIGGVLAGRQLRSIGEPEAADLAALEDPIIAFSPRFVCHCPRALKVLVSATLVGLLTGFLGVGGGFLVVPALLLALGLPMRYAAGTSLLVITMTSAVALAVRGAADLQPDWRLVILLTVAAAVGAVLGVRLAGRVAPRALSGAFTVLVLLVASYTAWQSLPHLI